MAHYNMTVAATVTTRVTVIPYRRCASIVFEAGVNALRWLAGSLRTNWGTHDG
jgi:hypothetical protein